MVMTDDLSHHGILGQKWGVRRFQNPDGSLTEEGRKRYGYGFHERVTVKSGTSVKGAKQTLRSDKLFGKDKERVYAYAKNDKLSDAFYDNVANSMAGRVSKLIDASKSDKVEIEATDDLIAPAYHEASKIFTDTLLKRMTKSDNPAWPILGGLAGGVIGGAVSGGITTLENFNRFFGSYKDAKNSSIYNKDVTVLLSDTKTQFFNKAIQDEKFYNMLSKALKKEGFNAIVDYNSAKVNEATGKYSKNLPLIVFDNNGKKKTISIK